MHRWLGATGAHAFRLHQPGCPWGLVEVGYWCFWDQLGSPVMVSVFKLNHNPFYVNAVF